LRGGLCAALGLQEPDPGDRVKRRRARERAILERAARAQASSSWLLDPKILGAAMQAGRTLGWQRLVPIALLAFMAAQWAREYRDRRPEDEASS